MTILRRWRVAGAAILALAGLSVAAAVAAPGIAAGGLLHPARRPVTQLPPASCATETFQGSGVALKGWRCEARPPRRGTLVFLHGVADNRASVAGAVGRFVAIGLDVIAYDSRAQGESDGAACTYGYWEKEDLKRVLDTAKPGPVVLVGTSLGAAVAIQEAAVDPRVTAIVAAEVFSDLETVARERAPRFLTESIIRKAFVVAEAQGGFRIADVSPVNAARNVRVPVLLIHGTLDTDTPPDHSRRVYEALGGPKMLLFVPGARHNESLRSGQTWQQIQEWVDRTVRGAILTASPE